MKPLNCSITGCSLLSHLDPKVHAMFVQNVFLYREKDQKPLTSIPLRVCGVNIQHQPSADVSFHFVRSQAVPGWSPEATWPPFPSL